MSDPTIAPRVLRIVHSEAATAFGGQEHRIFKEMRAMRARGHTLEAICQPGSGLERRLREEGFTVHPVAMSGVKNYLSGVRQSMAILRAGNYDVLNTHSRRDTVVVGLAARLLRKRPLIVRTRHLAKRPGSLWSYTGIPDRVVAISDYVAQQMRERGVPEAKLATVFTAVNLPPKPDHSTLRAELGLAAQDDAILVGCVAHLRQQKGHDLLMRALAPHMHADLRIHFVLAGVGGELDKLRALSASLGIAERTHFLGRREDVPNVLAGLDVFALATQFEALGTAFIEASAYGVPIVGTNVGGVPEVVLDGESGLLVPFGDAGRLEAALGKLLGDAALRKSMGAAGAKHIRGNSKFTEAGMAEGMENAFLSWLQSGRPA